MNYEEWKSKLEELMKAKPEGTEVVYSLTGGASEKQAIVIEGSAIHLAMTIVNLKKEAEKHPAVLKVLALAEEDKE